MQRPGRMQIEAGLLMCLVLWHTATGKTLPVPYNNAGSPQPTDTSVPRVKSFEGVQESGSTQVQTFILLYDSKYAGSEMLDPSGSIASAGGTLVAHHPAIGVAFAKSTGRTFAADMKVADLRLTHVASTGTAGARRRKGSFSQVHGSGDGSHRAAGASGAAGGKLSRSLASTEGSGGNMDDTAVLSPGQSLSAGKRKILVAYPSQTPSIEAANSLLSVSPVAEARAGTASASH